MSWAKEYLMQLHHIRNRIAMRQEQLEELEGIASGARAIRYDKERIAVSLYGNRMEDTVLKCVEISGRLDGLIAYYEQTKDKIVGEIEGMPDNAADEKEAEKYAKYSMLLYKRYVEDKRLDIIAKEMGYSDDWVRHEHGKALTAFRKIYLLETHEGTFT